MKSTNLALSGIINDPMQMHLAPDPRDMYRFDWSSTVKCMLASADRINVFDSKMRNLQLAYKQLKLHLPFRALSPSQGENSGHGSGDSTERSSNVRGTSGES